MLERGSLCPLQILGESALTYDGFHPHPGGQGDLDIDFGAMSAEVPADNNSVGSAGAQPAGMDSLDMGDEFNAAPGMPAQEMDDDLFRSAAPSQAPELGMESSFGNENLVGSEGQQEEDHLGMMQVNPAMQVILLWPPLGFSFSCTARSELVACARVASD